MERGICPIAVLYFAVIHSFINTLKRCWSIRVQILPQRYIVTILGHVGHVIIRSVVGGFL